MPEISQRDLDPKEPERIVADFEWEGGKVVIRYAEKEKDYAGVLAAIIDRKEQRAEHIVFEKPQKPFDAKDEMEVFERSFSEPDNCMVLVMMIDNRVGGYIEMEKKLAGSKGFGKDGILIDTYSLLRDYQGKKDGNKRLSEEFLNPAIEEARKKFGIDYFKLHAIQKNEQAVKFWIRQGFLREGEPSLRDGDKAGTWDGEKMYNITMVKDLNKIK